MQTLHSTCGLHVRSIESRLRNILLLFCVSICCGQSGLTYGALVTFHHHELDPDGGHTQIADINGDGKNDVVSHHTDHLAWLPNPNYQKRLI
jgi:hypothetical protein